MRVSAGACGWSAGVCGCECKWVRVQMGVSAGGYECGWVWVSGIGVCGVGTACESREKDGGTRHDEPHVSVTSLPYSPLMACLRGGGSCSHYEQHSDLREQYIVVLAVCSEEEQTKQTGQECSQSVVCQHSHPRVHLQGANLTPTYKLNTFTVSMQTEI